MRILIVEDNEDKATQLKEVCLELLQAMPDHVRGLRGAYPALASKVPWDLIILDMTLHAAEGQLSAISKESLAGIEILQALNAGGRAIPVLVATQHDVFRQENISFKDIPSLDEALTDAFPGIYFGIVRVRLGDDEWKLDMRRKIQNIFAGS
ncbi:hypothetical protein DC415_10360 [Agrobacterium tumefaciens]|uniref:Uncharacterized protein n=1 Tax=Rhizobium rhizogenes TaxID=359 RepID=A0AA92H7J9_RHIRH|nr:hypothetical protein DC430_21715 [Rhizobium rhizogenes]PVE65384.1 hypothetical protein DC415_10360 [Agrobacterium tumefaciens]PVE75448.1 hypothetical protein DCP16_10360 [Sphingomonas sp. TPD3009]